MTKKEWVMQLTKLVLASMIIFLLSMIYDKLDAIFNALTSV